MTETTSPPRRRLVARHPAAIAATCFGIGYLPFAPGTAASLAALPMAWALDLAGGRPAILLAALALATIGWWAGAVYVRHHHAEDPSEVVIDEVAAQLLVLTVVPLTPLSIIAGFVLFRVFDIVKPWPVSWADRKVKGGLGVMLDDLLAALYAALGLIAFIWLAERLPYVS